MAFSHDRRTGRVAPSLGRNEDRGKAIEQDPLGLGPLPNGVALIGESDSILRIGRDVARAASTLITVLIQGETGTGKEIIANSLHALSQRSNKPFVVVNCAEFSDGLIESQLFGHRKGSFTGANADKKGLFDEADGGTIFFDEIGEMPLLQQPKLLRVLQERKIHPVGAPKPHPIDVRLIAATNRDLVAEVQAGHFRGDLLQRIKVLRIYLPPLRERGNDIRLLIQHFLKKVFPIVGLDQPARITPDAVACLCSYSWPGNVRELENVIIALSLKSRESGNMITLELVEHELQPPTRPVILPSSAISFRSYQDLADFQERERQKLFERFDRELSALEQQQESQMTAFLKRAIDANSGNLSATAKQIDFERSQLSRRARQFGLIGRD